MLTVPPATERNAEPANPSKNRATNIVAEIVNVTGLYELLHPNQRTYILGYSAWDEPDKENTIRVDIDRPATVELGAVSALPS